MEYKHKRLILLAITLILFGLLYALKNYSMTIRIFSAIFAMYFFYFFDHLFHIDYKFRHYLYALLILVFGVLLSFLYFVSPNYDKILHLFVPIILSAMIFFSIQKLKIDYKWKLVLTFTILVTLITMFEIGEFALDSFFDLKLQGVYIRDISGIEKYNILMDRNDDTMVDLILGSIGSLLYISMNLLGKKIRSWRHH